MSFERAFEQVVGHEGGYVDHPSDPGGETRFGISKRAYPGEDIASMTLDRARLLYRRDYWYPIRGDALPEAVAIQVFDAAVNHGVRTAVRMMQRALGVEDDGVIGPVTLIAMGRADDRQFVARFNAERLLFYTDLPTWGAFGKGWARRVAVNLRQA
jgi:lysozyme family protein